MTGVRDAGSFQEIDVEPTGAEAAPEEVLVILDPVHESIPDGPAGDSPVFLAPDVKPDGQNELSTPVGGTTADKMIDQYKKIGDAQKHVYGEGLPGSTPPNFNLKVPGVNAPADPAAPATPPGTPNPPTAKSAAPGAAAPVATGAQPHPAAPAGTPPANPPQPLPRPAVPNPAPVTQPQH